MNDKIRDLLEEEIRREIESLKTLSFGSQAHATAAETVAKLYKLKLEEDKSYTEHVEQVDRHEVDIKFKRIQLEEAVKERFTRIGIAAAEIVLPLVFYGVWMKRGFEFEKDGVFTSQTFRGLFSRFKPTKK